MANFEELEKIDTSEIYRRRINAKEILTPQKGDKSIFTVADGTAKLLGRDHEFRESAQRQEQPEERKDLSGQLQGEPEGFSTDRIKRRRRSSYRLLVNSKCFHLSSPQ